MAELTLNETAIRVLRARYLLKDREGRTVETPEGMFRRVARTIALADAFYFEEVRGKPLRHVDAEIRHLPPEVSERLSRHMLRQLHRAYVRKLRRREVRVSFREFLAILAERWDDVFRVEEEFYDLMTSRRFLPNSPTLMNAGAPLGQLSACFVIPVEDSIEGIMDALALAAKVQKSGGGTGFSFSRLRPEGDIVHSTGGQASGPVSFMKLFDTLTEVIKQGGKRRGANMGVLDVHHPDIEKFITCKADGRSFQNFNISVAASDEFMEAVIHGRKYPLINPRTGEVVKMEDARYIWNLIVQNAWRTGDPGLIFIDRINRMHPARHLGKIEATNPCVTGETLITTSRGLVRADELRVGDRVWTPFGWAPVEEVLVREEDVYELEFDNGLVLRATGDHQVATPGGWVEVSKLREGTRVRLVIEPVPDFPDAEFDNPFDGVSDIELAEFLGLWVGDGFLSSSGKIGISVGHDEKLREKVEKLFEKIIGGYHLVKRVASEKTFGDPGYSIEVRRKNAVELIKHYFGEMEHSSSESKRVPEAILRAPLEVQKAFLRGLFSADGSVFFSTTTLNVSLSSKSLDLIHDVQIMLLSMGIPATIHKEKGEQHRLVMTGWRALRFLREIGFLNRDKEEIEEILKKYKKAPYPPRYEKASYAKLVSKTHLGRTKVYDVTSPPYFVWTTNGVLSMDCGEQPLLPYESCNLGSINLSLFIKDGKFDEDAFRATVRQAVHFLDNVIDMNMMPDPRLEEAMLRTRKIGLGVMGFADALVLMGIQYDSGEALEAIDLMGGVLKEEAHAASVDLAGVRGTFPAYRGSLWDELGVPRRNAAVTTVAPTGTISLIAGCSSSIEPYFALVYYRKHAEDVGEWMDAVPLFIEYLHRYGIYSEGLLREVAKTGSVQHVPGVPEEIKRLFRTAHDIHYEWHVRIQAQWQKYIEASISKTINLPHDARPDDISRAMLLAYELGAKGVTVYRDRSKDAQVLMKPIDVSKLKVVLTEDKFLVDEDFGGYCRTEGECD